MPQAIPFTVSDGSTNLTYAPIGPLSVGSKNATQRFVHESLHATHAAGNKTVATWSSRNQRVLRTQMQTRLPILSVSSNGVTSATQMVLVNTEVVLPVGAANAEVVKALTSHINTLGIPAFVEAMTTGRNFY